MLSTLAKLPILKRLIPSIGIRLLKFLNKNRQFFLIQNIEMYLDFLDPIDREIILLKEFEKTEYDFLHNQINKNGINYFLDIGANCGYYSLKIANEFPNINILSFEPNQRAYLKFLKSLEKNPKLFKKINLKNYGLSDKSGKLKMESMIKFGYPQTGGSTIVKKDVRENFHSFFADFKVGDKNINLNQKNIAIKIDVEGHEPSVLNGLKKTLVSNNCILQIEIFESNFENVNNFLNSLHYKILYKVNERQNYFYSNIN